MDIAVAPELEGKLRYAALFGEEIAVRREAPDLWREIETLEAEYRGRYRGVPPSEVEALAPARDLYKAAGVDPTRRRPASEALFRRAVKGKKLYRINNAVDASNYCSLRFLLPIGLYDRDKIRGTRVVIRLGREGEAYAGHGKETVHLGGHILLADDEGPFGHPSADSVRTAVEPSTARLLWIVFAPFAFDPHRLAEHAAVSQRTLCGACGGRADIRFGS